MKKIFIIFIVFNCILFSQEKRPASVSDQDGRMIKTIWDNTELSLEINGGLGANVPSKNINQSVQILEDNKGMSWKLGMLLRLKVLGVIAVSTGISYNKDGFKLVFNNTDGPIVRTVINTIEDLKIPLNVSYPINQILNGTLEVGLGFSASKKINENSSSDNASDIQFGDDIKMNIEPFLRYTFVKNSLLLSAELRGVANVTNRVTVNNEEINNFRANSINVNIGLGWIIHK